MRSHLIGAVAGLTAAGLTLVACSGTSSQQHTAAVSISVSRCGTGWQPAHAGTEHIVLRNVDSRAGEARLINPRTSAVFADAEPIGPGTTVAVDVNLGPGHYAWQCVMEDEAPVVGAPVALTGHATNAPHGVLPVSQGDLIAPTKAYEHYVTHQLPQLKTDTEQLRTDLSHNRLADARRDWLPAHLDYERLGAAYDAFGDLDGAINGLPDGLPGGVHDKQWTGFHRIEYGLWHGQNAAALRPLAAHLAASITALGRQFAGAQIDPLTVSIRAHEISENALQFELGGHTDYGSHSALQTVGANLDGTQEVLDILRPLLAPRYPDLPAAERQLHQTQQDLAAHADHDRLVADVSELCELLAPVASILEPRITQ